MPIAHFKDLTGIAPRVRGATGFANKADGVDLYGGTIRAQKKDLGTGQIVSGDFVRVEGVTIPVPDATNASVMQFKGYHVIIYKKGSTWYKMVIREPNNPATHLITPLGFTPPQLEKTDVESVQESIITSTAPGSKLTSIDDIVFRRHTYGRDKLPIPEDEYTYHVDVFGTVKGKEILLERSEYKTVKIEYKRFLPDGAYPPESFQEAERVARGDDTRWWVRDDNSHRSLIALIPDDAIPPEGQFNSPWGSSDLAGNPNLRTIMARSARFVAQGGATTIYDKFLVLNTEIIDPIYGKFTWFGEADRWSYPVNAYQGSDFSELSNRARIGASEGVYTIEGDKPELDLSDSNSLSDGAKGQALKIKHLPKREATSYSDDAVIIHQAEPSSKNSFGVVFKMRKPAEGFNLSVDFGKNSPLSESIDDNETEVPLTYRLYRKGTKESSTRVVNEIQVNRNEDVVELIDLSNIREGEKGAVKHTYSYLTTYGRLAGNGGNVLEDWSEESGPSSTVEIQGFSPAFKIKRPNQKPIGIGSFPRGSRQKATAIPAPASSVKTWNIYRRRTEIDEFGRPTIQGTANYQFVAEVDIDELEYYDFHPDEELGETPETQFLDEPVPFQYEEMPRDIEGVSTLHDGMMFGWKGNSLYWTDRFYLSGWTSTTFNLESVSKIVNAIPIRGGIALVTVNGIYRLVTDGPTNVNLTLSPTDEGGVPGNQDSVISTSAGILYLSDSGIHRYDGSSTISITDGLIGEEYFREQVVASSVKLATNDGNIYMFHNGGVLVLDTRSRQVTTIDEIRASEIFKDNTTGSIFYLDSNTNEIKELFGGTEYREYTYKTGPIHFGSNGPKQVFDLEFLGSGKITCSVFIDGSFINQGEVNMDGMEHETRILIPDGTLGKSFQFEMTGKGEVQEFKIDWERV